MTNVSVYRTGGIVPKQRRGVGDQRLSKLKEQVRHNVTINKEGNVPLGMDFIASLKRPLGIGEVFASLFGCIGADLLHGFHSSPLLRHEGLAYFCLANSILVRP